LAANARSKYLKSDFRMYDEVNNSNQRGCRIQRASQQDCGAMEDQQAGWLFPKGLPSNHRVLQQREVIMNNQLINYIINQSIIQSIFYPMVEVNG